MPDKEQAAEPGPKRFLLRLDPRVYDALQRWADEEFRSVNSQIQLLLHDSLRRAGREPKAGPRKGE